MSEPSAMFVVKRNGSKQSIQFDKITRRISSLCEGLNSQFVDPVKVTMKVSQGIYSGVTTCELDTLAAETCAYLSTTHPDYSILAARICVSNLFKETEPDFCKVTKNLLDYINPETGMPGPLVTKEVYDVATKHKSRILAAIESCINSDMYSLDFFAFKTLEKSYLLKMNGKVAERPQHMLMRVAIGVHGDDIVSVIQTFFDMANKKYTHATPTLYNAGTPRAQMSSCFLMTMKEDSISGIYDTLKNCALISKYAGGIGLSIHDVRASNSYISGTNGVSNGLVPMLRVFNNTARYVDQGGGRRKGSFAIYLEPWHADIEDFIDLKKNHGNDLERARDLFYALWVPDLFMKRVEKDQEWSLFCPKEAPGLSDVYGTEFEELYESHEKTSKIRKKVSARDLFYRIIDNQVETGTPYILFKDSCNAKSNQKSLGIIKGSNLCAEIVQYVDSDEIAVCNLASVNLSSLVKNPMTDVATFDFEQLEHLAYQITINLNRIIDRNFYPVPEARNSNMRHRPIGIGVQGLADTFVTMRIPFESPEARVLNTSIFETMYYGAIRSSIDLAKKDGSYETFQGSPASEGKFQFDLWGSKASDRYDWDSLRESMVEHGLRNSLLIACMPTASTAQILGNNESFEAFTSNVYNRRVLAGEFAVVNKHLLKDLTDLGLWGDKIKEKLMRSQGSVQDILEIPEHIRKLYKTGWEISQKVIVDHAADRGKYVCQSQSMNIFMADPSRGKLISMLFYGWRSGLKTGVYYLRTKPKADAIQFVIDQGVSEKARKELGATLDDDEICVNCSA